MRAASGVRWRTAARAFTKADLGGKGISVAERAA